MGRGRNGLGVGRECRGLRQAGRPKESGGALFWFSVPDALPDNHIYKAEPEGHLYFQSAYRPLKGKSLCRQQKVQAESDYKGTSAK